MLEEDYRTVSCERLETARDHLALATLCVQLDERRRVRVRKNVVELRRLDLDERHLSGRNTRSTEDAAIRVLGLDVHEARPPPPVGQSEVVHHDRREREPKRLSVMRQRFERVMGPLDGG